MATACHFFTASVKVMENENPYTVILTTNLRAVYGIVLALLSLGGRRKMSTSFYIGAVIIVITVII
jgi:predicted membrane channel-forming protein YqfA (hemolysin III family)